MKFRITMKDPDCVYDAVKEAAKEMVAQIEGIDEDEKELLIESKREKLSALAGKWFEYGEYLTVEIDTDAASITVIEK